jgi:hypothetical protein
LAFSHVFLSLANNGIFLRNPYSKSFCIVFQACYNQGR